MDKELQRQPKRAMLAAGLSVPFLLAIEQVAQQLPTIAAIALRFISALALFMVIQALLTRFGPFRDDPQD